MQPLRREPPLRRPPRDPAPSRTAYRIQRLWLTPLFRSLLRTGLPAFALAFGALWLISDVEMGMMIPKILKPEDLEYTFAVIMPDLEQPWDIMNQCEKWF